MLKHVSERRSKNRTLQFLFLDKTNLNTKVGFCNVSKIVFILYDHQKIFLISFAVNTFFILIRSTRTT